MKNLILVSFLSLVLLSACVSKGSETPSETEPTIVEQQATPLEKFAEGTKIDTLSPGTTVTAASGTVQVSESVVGGTPRLPPQ